MKFRWRFALQHFLKLVRQIVIGKAAAVIFSWVLKNALWLSFLLIKAWSVGVGMKEVRDPEFIQTHHLEFQFLVGNLAIFLLLLLFAATMRWWFQQGGFTECIHRHHNLEHQLEEFEEGTVVTRSLTNLVRSGAGAESLAEMNDFYVAGIAFIPAWAYKDFIDYLIKWLTSEQVYSAVGNHTQNVADAVGNHTKTVAEPLGSHIQKVTEHVGNHTKKMAEHVGNHTKRVTEHIKDAAGIDDDQNNKTDDINKMDKRKERRLGDEEGEEEVASEDDLDENEEVVSEGNNAATNEEVASEDNNAKIIPQEVAEKGEEVLNKVTDPRTAWRMFLAVGSVFLAATLQVTAHTAVQDLEGGHWEFLKHVFSTLETCLGLGTGSVFWDVCTWVFEGVITNWIWRTIYVLSVSVCAHLVQVLLRRCKGAPVFSGDCLQRSIDFNIVALNFVIAWAWKAWLVQTFGFLTACLLGPIPDQDHQCILLYKMHFMMNAFQITLFGVLVLWFLDIFEDGTELTKAATLITGINAGWAWMGFVASIFECEQRVTFLKLWFYAVVIIAITLAICFLLEFAVLRTNKKIQELRKQAGTLNDDDKSYWKESESSSNADDSVDSDSEDDDDDSETEDDSGGSLSEHKE